MFRIESLLGVLLLGATSFAQASNPAADWFERMRDAVHGVNYEGRFVYQVGSQLESLYVVRRVTGNAEFERLVALNGDEKQVIRGDRAVACLVPGKHRVSVIEGMVGPPLESSEPDVEKLQRHYAFSLHEGQRVANRRARMIKVEPLDTLRFGYEIYVDVDTALPLRTVMLDTQGVQQSQMMFVDLKTGPDITPIEHDVSALQLAQADRITVSADVSDPSYSSWRFEGLPDGFELRSYRVDGQREHFILSDGLATLSTYLEPADPVNGLNGFSRVGATNAFGTVRANHQITTVGEVPAKTLRLIANAIVPK
jgi:sigma-E factor negative regulatory protein RseB